MCAVLWPRAAPRKESFSACFQGHLGISAALWHVERISPLKNQGYSAFPFLYFVQCMIIYPSWHGLLSAQTSLQYIKMQRLLKLNPNPSVAQLVGHSTAKWRNQFDSWLGHMLGLWVLFLVRAHTRSNQLMFLSHIWCFPPSLSPSLPLFLKRNKIF